MVDILAAYKKKNPFYFQAGIMLLMAALFTYLLGAKDNYLNLGFGMLVIYLIQAGIEKLTMSDKIV